MDRFDAYARYGPFRLVDLAVPFLSVARASIPLPPYGTFGLDPTLMAALPPFVIPQPAGVASVSLTVPNDASLVGAPIFGQALLIQYPASTRLTTVTADVISDL